MPRLTNGGVRIKTTDLTPPGGQLGDAFDVGGVTSIDIPPNIETQTDDAGLAYPQSISIVSQAPVPTFTTKNLGLVLAAIGLNGYCISSDGTHPGLQLFGRILGDCANPPGTNSDTSYTVAHGLAILGTLTAERGQDATLTVEVHSLSDGAGAKPVVEAHNATVPTTLLEAQYTAGHFIAGGLPFNDESTGWSLAFGATISDKLPNLGEVTPTSVAVRRVEPVLTINGLDPTMVADAKFSFAGRACTHANTILQLRKRQSSGVFIPDATAEHLRVSLSGLAIVESAFAGSSGADATNTIRLQAISDGTNAPVLLNLAAQYDSDLLAA